MRTRIALAAAATAVVSISITNGVLSGSASGSPARTTRPSGPTRPARGTRAARPEVTWQTAGVGLTESRAATAPVPSFLAPALGVVDRRGAHHRAGEHAASLDVLTPTWALAAHTAQMQRVVDAWRAAHPAPVPASPPAPAPEPQPVPTDATSTTTADWACIRLHESGDRFNTPAAPGGAYGFLESTWLSLGYSGWPYQAPPAVQDRAVLFLYNELGWQPWSTRFVCGL